MENQKILVVRKMSALEYYYNGNHESAAIRESAESHNKNIMLIEEILRKNKKDFRIVTRKELSEELIAEYDVVISAGGDGTVIATAFYNKKTPQLNLRTDSKSVGALCLGDIEHSLNNFLAGKYSIKEWTRQDVYLDGKFIGRALNEVSIGEQLKFSKLAKYSLNFIDEKTGLLKEEKKESGSGLVIVTGTGSTAWPAAFKPFSRDSNYFKFATILPHSGSTHEGETKEIYIEYKGHEGRMAIDTAEFEIPRDSKIKIELSKYPLKVIDIEEK